MRFNLKSTLLMIAGVALLPTGALAHPKLVAATPAANATVARTKTVKLSFSERLMPKMSSATLTMTGMPGMKDHPPMKMTGVTSAVGADGKSIVLTSRTPLAAGSYRADWVVVSADTHRVTGAHAFAVR